MVSLIPSSIYRSDPFVATIDNPIDSPQPITRVNVLPARQKLSSTERYSLGFSLIELLIVVSVLAILAAIAYPSYQGYVERGKRADMMAEMQQIASRIEAHKLTYRRYDRIPLQEAYARAVNDTAGAVDFPSSGSALYSVVITPNNGRTLTDANWTITATPKADGMMAKDGTMTIDRNGRRCRDDRCGMGDEWRQ